MAVRELVQDFYRSLSKKDDHWQQLYSEDAFFSDASQTLHAQGKAAVIQSFIPFIKNIEEVKVKQLIIEDEQACAVISYVFVNPKGEKISQDVAEVWGIKDDKLAELTVYFDLTVYRNFMRG